MMDDGGWTLIGEDGGFVGSKYENWLRGNHNSENLAAGTEITAGEYACIDAVDMAVNHATKVHYKLH